MNALEARYRRVLLEMRLHSKWEKNNAIPTGGGPTEAKPKKLKIEATPPILAVYNRFGHLMTGIPAIYLDRKRAADSNVFGGGPNNRPRTETMTSGAYEALQDSESPTNKIESQLSIGCTEKESDAAIGQQSIDSEALNAVSSSSIVKLKPTIDNPTFQSIKSQHSDATVTTISILPTTTPLVTSQLFASNDQLLLKNIGISNNNNNGSNSSSIHNNSWNGLQLVNHETLRAAELHQFQVKMMEQKIRHREAIFQKKILYWNALINSVSSRQSTIINTIMPPPPHTTNDADTQLPPPPYTTNDADTHINPSIATENDDAATVTIDDPKTNTAAATKISTAFVKPFTWNYRAGESSNEDDDYEEYQYLGDEEDNQQRLSSSSSSEHDDDDEDYDPNNE